MNATEDLSSFGSLPDELLVKICNSMDNASLSKFLRTYGRTYQVCSKILETRVNDVVNLILNSKSIRFYKYIEGTPSELRINHIKDLHYKSHDDDLYHISQVDYVDDIQPWILPDITYTRTSYVTRGSIKYYVRGVSVSKEVIPELAKRIIALDYK